MMDDSTVAEATKVPQFSSLVFCRSRLIGLLRFRYTANTAYKSLQEQYYNSTINRSTYSMKYCRYIKG